VPNVSDHQPPEPKANGGWWGALLDPLHFEFRFAIVIDRENRTLDPEWPHSPVMVVHSGGICRVSAATEQLHLREIVADTFHGYIDPLGAPLIA